MHSINQDMYFSGVTDLLIWIWTWRHLNICIYEYEEHFTVAECANIIWEAIFSFRHLKFEGIRKCSGYLQHIPIFFFIPCPIHMK